MKISKKDMKRFILPLLIFTMFSLGLNAQAEEEREEKITINGHVFTAYITGTDTIIMADLEDIAVTSPREFENRADYRRYRKYRYYGSKVYPYAQKAIVIFKDVEEATKNMRKRKRKRYTRKKYKQLKREFKKPLKNLTKTQGMLLIKMIEKELDTPFYDLMKGVRNGLTASYWHQMGKFYDYNLKEGYQEGKDPILDVVLQDFDVSYKKN